MILTFKEWIWKVHRLTWRRFNNQSNAEQFEILKQYDNFIEENK